MDFFWHKYRYYPYERELARREIHALLGGGVLQDTALGIRVVGDVDMKAAERLVYFSGAIIAGRSEPTIQAQLERVNGNGVNRQLTRYSAHGLHEYKGKFNPQIARAILNILDIPPDARVLDPFCGSGTSLLECVHFGMRAVGTDINPLAVFIANAKVSAIRIPATELAREVKGALRRMKSARVPEALNESARGVYLLSWFDREMLDTIERLRISIQGCKSECVAPLLAIASNLLRDYSQQDPNDLRIRRRKTPLPDVPLEHAFKEAAENFVARLEVAQSVIKRPPRGSRAVLLDSRALRLGERGIGTTPFDCVVTSPPYATALPYIDTQRLSLVWLELITPSEILSLEAQLVGSREVRAQSKKDLRRHLMENSAALPDVQANYCRQLQRALSPEDGFRRQAVPLLLYRYFDGMVRVFRAVHSCVKKNAPFALIVGGNHTVLGGERFDINTPKHLADLAVANGWFHMETIPLQTYQRYGYHMSNAVGSEALVIVRAA